jgi:hypothetical protein
MLSSGGYPMEWIQRPEQVTVIYEAHSEIRRIYIGGAAPNPRDLIPSRDGSSFGRWEGDTLVVETSGFRDDGWLDIVGTPMTEQAKMTERFRRVSYGRMEIDITVDDPKAYTKPWTVRHNQVFMPDQEIIEFICEENQRFGVQPGLGPAAGTKKN